MDPELVFSVANLLPLPVWGTWILAPRSRLARYFAESLWPFGVLAGLYAALLIVGLVAGGAEGGSFSSLEGVMAMLGSPWGALAGWVHYLCFDLFVGRWIVRDAGQPGYLLSPILLLTLLLGPTGLLCWLLVRGRLGGAEAALAGGERRGGA